MLKLVITHGSPEAFRLLQEHHSNNWVEEELLHVWRQMGKQFIVFELWKGEELVAADFAHTVGTHCYVATRCHHPKEKRLGAGFILGLVSMKVLQQHGFKLYDLGGFDSSPMMSYKQEMTNSYDRLAFLSLLVATQQCNPHFDGGLSPAVLIPHITADDLFAFAE